MNTDLPKVFGPIISKRWRCDGCGDDVLCELTTRNIERDFEPPSVCVEDAEYDPNWTEVTA